MISRVPGVIILMAVLLIGSNELHAQDTFDDVIYQSYIKGEISGWNRILDNTPAPRNNIQKEYEYILAHYGFIGYCVWADQKDAGKRYLKKAMKLTDDLLSRQKNDPRIFALKGSLYGLQIGLEKGMAPFLGPKALRNIEKALEVDPQNPQALIEAGNKNWNMPRFMGGSRTKAIAGFEKAIRLMEKNEEFIRNNWYYLNVLVTLANWYEEEGKINQSKRIRRKLLVIEPDLKWPKENF